MKANAAVFTLTLVTLMGGLRAQQPGDELTPEQLKFFEAKVRPILVASCYECHSTDEKIKGGLTLNTKSGIQAGGDSGPAVVPHDLDASLLWTAINWSDPDYEMPPKRKLSQEDISVLGEWIRMGAPDPRVSEAAVVDSDIDIEAGREFWSFQKPVKAAPPEISNPGWAVNDIDRFIMAALDEQGLTPAPDADALTLLRRLSFVLTGLPPTPEEVQAFHSAWQQDPDFAFEYKMDELLARPQFGERWGRLWLDVARYAESTGKDNNQLYPHAWRYRDYVIDSFNEDKPYDRFIREQIAGDLLPVKTDEEWQENLVATGFLAMGVKGLNENSARQFRMDVVDEQIDTTTQAVLGLTVACARCHDHKFDPIPTGDYYAMAGIFLSTDTYYGTIPAIQNRRATDLLLLPIEDTQPVSRRYSAQEMENLRAQLEKAERDLADARRENLSGGPQTADLQRRLIGLNTQTNLIRHQLAGLNEDGTPKSFAMGVQASETPLDARVLVRGEVDQPAQEVERGFVQVLQHEETPEISPDSTGRLELADWMVSRENPLTARVMVNRVWQHLFGAGLVGTPDNFGTTGQAPTHPELLDYLAVRFMDEGWSVKSLIREIVMSRTWQMSSEFSAANYGIDPDNEYLWRANQRRLDAESLRDAILAAGGNLDLERPRGSAVAEAGMAREAMRLAPGYFDTEGLTYRSVYLPIVRDDVPESLSLFDFAEPSLVTGQRESTNVPSQALYLMNNPFVIAQANGMAARILRAADQPRARASMAFVIAFGRLGTEDELNSSVDFFRTFIPEALKKTNGDTEEAGFLAMSAFCQGLLASAEYRYLE